MKDIRKVKKGNIISLRDEQTLEDVLSETGKAVTGLDLTVSEVSTIRETSGIALWKRIKFKESGVVLIIKEVEDEYDVRAYFPPDGFEPGDRRNLLEAGWLSHVFDGENEVLSGLEPHRYLNILFDDLGDVEFAIKGGVLYGTDEQDRFCTVTEWSTTQECPNPELIMFELGGEDNDDGGYIAVYQGVNLFPEEFELL